MSDAEAKVLTIAIIDDDEPVRFTMSSLVRSLGFNADVFSSAVEFLTSPQRYRSSCIISDVQMPGMSGLDLQKQLAAEGQRVPIIFVTAFPHPNIEKRALAAGAECVLNKPFESCVLVEASNGPLVPGTDLSRSWTSPTKVVEVVGARKG